MSAALTAVPVLIAARGGGFVGEEPSEVRFRGGDEGPVSALFSAVRAADLGRQALSVGRMRQ